MNSVNGKLLAKAKNRLKERHRERERLLEHRTREVYLKVPRIKELDTRIRSAMTEYVGIALGANPSARAEDIYARSMDLQDERRRELLCAGFAEDYLDDEYICDVCGDTGYKDGKMCKCLADLYREEKNLSLSSLLKMGNETFESFNLSYYDDTPAKDTGISPRQSMEIIFETCVQYAQKWGKHSMNLFFNGAPGLGKTFLSACIARVVSEKGYSVVYDMACTIFSKFEDVKFSKAEDLNEAREEIKKYLECDLLIIDDLGTEMTTAHTIEALYEIVNTRLISNRKTIVNSNLTIDEIRRRYSEQIMSRLEGEYQVLTFYGTDIRRIKKYAD